MKQLLIFILCCQTFAGFAEQPVFVFSEADSVFRERPHRQRIELSPEAKCRANKRLQIAGITLLSLGAATSGVCVYFIDRYQKSIWTSASGRSYSDVGSAMGAGLIGVVSLALLGTGIPLTIQGTLSRKKWCKPHNSRSYLQLQSTANGLGLALRF